MRLSEVGHLRSAVERMDLLLATKHVDAGLVYLVDLLRHLRALRRRVA